MAWLGLSFYLFYNLDSQKHGLSSWLGPSNHFTSEKRNIFRKDILGSAGIEPGLLASQTSALSIAKPCEYPVLLNQLACLDQLNVGCCRFQGAFSQSVAVKWCLSLSFRKSSLKKHKLRVHQSEPLPAIACELCARTFNTVNHKKVFQEWLFILNLLLRDPQFASIRSHSRGNLILISLSKKGKKCQFILVRHLLRLSSPCWQFVQLDREKISSETSLMMNNWTLIWSFIAMQLP